MKEIYQQTVEEVLDYVESIESGLTSEQVKRSRENCGWNELAEGKKKSILQIFFEQYKDFLVLILIASAVISGMLLFFLLDIPEKIFKLRVPGLFCVFSILFHTAFLLCLKVFDH